MEQAQQEYEYHRLARSLPQHRWWKPLLTALLAVAFYVVLLLLVLAVGLLIAFRSPAGLDPYMDPAAAIDLSDPLIFAFTLASLIIMIPVLALAAFITGTKPLGLLSSVAGRIRWRWLLLCSGVAAVIYGVGLGVSLVVGYFFPEESAVMPTQPDSTTLIILLALTLFAVPFQAAAEEYVFRGFLMQAIGSWLRHPAFAILLPVPLFVLGHLYDPLGQTYIAIFAIFAGWISWRTGGLEAAIAVHAVNNMTLFALGAFGLVDVNATEGSLSGLTVSVLTMAVTAVVIVRLADRRGIARTRTVTPPPVLQPTYPHGPGQPPFGHQLPTQQAQAWQGQGQAHARHDQARQEPQAVLPAHPAHGVSGPQHQGASAPASAPPSASSRGGATAAPPGPTPSAPTTPASDSSDSSATRDHGADGYPSGPAHPPGPGYPAGTPHPPGPAYPAAGPSATASDREQG